MRVEANSFVNMSPAANGDGSSAIVVWASYGDPVLIRNNTFVIPDGGIAVELPAGYTSAAVDARSNYWGTTNLVAINDLILDANDDLNRASVIPVGNPLSAPHPGAPAVSLLVRGTVGTDTLTGANRNESVLNKLERFDIVG